MKTIYVVICQLFSYRKWKCVTQSCPTLCNPMDYGNSLGQTTGVGSLSLLQGVFPTQGSNPGLPQCRQILYQLSHQGSPWILEWVAYPFSSGSSWPRNWTGVSCTAGGFFTNWAMEKNIKIPMMVIIQKKSSKGYRGFPYIIQTLWSPNLIGAHDSHERAFWDSTRPEGPN